MANDEPAESQRGSTMAGKRWRTTNGGPVPGSENFLPIRKLSHQRSVHKHKRASKKEKEGRERMCFLEHKTQVQYKYLCHKSNRLVDHALGSESSPHRMAFGAH